MASVFKRFGYCFCCKLFNSDCDRSKLANEGTKDWRNLSVKLKSHETTNEHITNMNTLIDLEIRLLKNKKIDKNIQEEINKEKLRSLEKSIIKNY